MADPTAVATATVSAAFLTIAGVSTGIPLDLLPPAFLGALWSLRAHPPASLWWRVAQVFGGALCGAWTAPLAAHYLHVIAPGAEAVPQVARYPIAIALGFGGLRLLAAFTDRLAAVEKTP